MSPATDDTVTVTHFSLDSWGQIEQKTTPLSPKVSNQSQNPFNPFTNDTGADTGSKNAPEATEEEVKPEDDKQKNTNPFIDSNPFLGILNPFKEPQQQPVAVERKTEPLEPEKAGARVVKTEEIQTTTTTLTHKVRVGFFFKLRASQLCNAVPVLLRNCARFSPINEKIARPEMPWCCGVSLVARR